MMQLLQIDRVEDEMIWTVINMRWVGLLFLLPRMETSSFSGPKPGVPSGAPRECYSKPRFWVCIIIGYFSLMPIEKGIVS
jgi:hypothetical protein